MLSRSALRLSAAAPLLMPRSAAIAPRAVMPVGVRQMSSGGSVVTLENIKRYYPQILGVAGAGVVVYGLTNVALSVIGSVLELDLHQAFNIGVVTGLSGALVLAGSTAYARRLISINPVAVMRRATSRVQQSPVAMNVLGNNIRVGDLAAWKTVPGHLSAKKFAWVEPRVQLLFQVFGDKGEGFITAEAVKHKGALVFNTIALDVAGTPARAATVHLIQGTDDKLHVKGALRGFLQTGRAVYVAQDRVEAEEDLIREQEAMPADENQEEELWRQAVASSKMPGRG